MELDESKIFTPTFEYLLENYKYLDDTSCGIKEK